MILSFASVGVKAFDLTLIDLNEQKVGFNSSRSVESIIRTIGRTLQDAEERCHNVIIRPRATTATLIQLDDLSAEKAGRIAPHAFIVFQTSPGNCQAWIALKDAPADLEQAKDFARRLRKGAGADKSASGATRVAGSVNFKTKYAPEFPRVTIMHTKAGQLVTMAELEQAGLVAPEEPSSPPQIPAPCTRSVRRWPDYEQALRGAPLNRAGTGPDRSLADFMWCKWAIERGWSETETAERLFEASERAAQEKRRGNPGYAFVTAKNAAKAVERERASRRLRHG
jgi:hypothetical protein